MTSPPVSATRVPSTGWPLLSGSDKVQNLPTASSPRGLSSQYPIHQVTKPTHYSINTAQNLLLSPMAWDAGVSAPTSYHPPCSSPFRDTLLTSDSALSVQLIF